MMYGGYMDLHVSVVDEFSGGCGERGCMVENVGHGKRMHARGD